MVIQGLIKQYEVLLGFLNYTIMSTLLKIGLTIKSIYNKGILYILYD